MYRYIVNLDGLKANNTIRYSLLHCGACGILEIAVLFGIERCYLGVGIGDFCYLNICLMGGGCAGFCLFGLYGGGLAMLFLGAPTNMRLVFCVGAFCGKCVFEGINIVHNLAKC